MIIDSHHHFWRYDVSEYGWIGPEMAGLRRDFLPPDLMRETLEAGVDGVVSVQARQSLAETRWLLELASSFDWIRGVVGWVDLTSPAVEQQLTALRSPKLKAVRHVLQDESDDGFMLREEFPRGVETVGRMGLAYDILIYERHLPQAIEFARRHEAQVLVLDHVGKPRIAAQTLEPWRSRIRELARCPNVYCKLSGLVTEADWRGWTLPQLRPYMETVLEAFGPERLMFGSDWPVCLVACQYARWLEIVQDFVAPLSPGDRQRVLAGSAIDAYRL